MENREGRVTYEVTGGHGCYATQRQVFGISERATCEDMQFLT